MLSVANSWILTVVILSPLLGAVLLWLPPRGDDRAVRRSAFFYSLVTLLVTVVAVFWFYDRAPQSDQDNVGFVLTHHVAWLGAFVPEGRTTVSHLDVLSNDADAPSRIDISYRVGVDGISMWLVVLTSFLTPLVIWSTFKSVKMRLREFYSLLLLLQVGLLGVFCALDLLLFYVFFEFTLVPLYFIIGIWGGPERKRAANKFFIYTLAGSVLTFAGILYLAYYTYTVSPSGMITLNIVELTQLAKEGFISYNVQWWLFLAFAAGFAIKVPLFPLHTWLPLAHTEAPTAGSVILAGVLLKLGTYGFCRLSIPIFPDATRHFAPLIAVVAIIGIIYAALAAWVQRDVKKLVAYSSVSHLGFCMLGLFSLKVAGVTGGVLYMVNHGLSTGALFLVVGFIYDRYHTRDIDKIGGLARPMPWMAFFLVFFTLSSIGLPGLNGFVGEFLVLLGTATSNTVGDLRAAGPLGYGYVIPAALGIILGAVYMLWMCQRILFGAVKEPANTPDTSTGLTSDLTRREISILAPIALACVILGVYPKPILQSFEAATVQHVLLKGASSFTAESENNAPAICEAHSRAEGFSPREPFRAGTVRDCKSCPRGAQDCSHGWSPAQPDVTRGLATVELSRPGGAKEALFTEVSRSQSLSPLPGRDHDFDLIHGFRSTRLSADHAPPVAKVLGPSGTDLMGGMATPAMRGTSNSAENAQAAAGTEPNSTAWPCAANSAKHADASVGMPAEISTCPGGVQEGALR